jgi:hypothetical protein
MTKAARSEASIWYARAEQARRIAGMLPPHDAKLVLAYAGKCDDSVRAALAGTLKISPDALTDNRQTSAATTNLRGRRMRAA